MEINDTFLFGFFIVLFYLSITSESILDTLLLNKISEWLNVN